MIRLPWSRHVKWPQLSIAALILTVGAGAQAPEPPEVRACESAEPFQIRVETNLVTVRVVVRDSKGHTLGGLRKEDFRLFDDGKPREIRGFTVETVRPDEAASPVPSAPGSTSSLPGPLPQRFIALYFDDLHLDYGAVGHTRNAVWKYISSALRPEDRVAIFTSSNHGDVDFTDDRAKIHDALFRLRPHSITDPLSSECPAIGEYQAFLIQERQDRSALDLAAEEGYACHCGHEPDCPYDGRRDATMKAAQVWDRAQLQSLDALEVADGAVRRLSAMPGQRVLVLVSMGFLSATRERDIGALIDRALRANVVINSLDAAGLDGKNYRNTNLADRPDLEARIFNLENEGVSVQHDVMAGLAAGTGGAFFHHSNDFDAGIRETAQAPEVSYVLSFSPTDVKMDGKFHALKVTAADRGDWDVQARRGYFATREAAPVKSNLETLMFSQEVRHELPVTLSGESEGSGVTVRIHVDISALLFRKERDRNVDTLTFHTALFDRDGMYVAGKQSSLELHLSEERLEQFRKIGINAESGFHVPPGAYRVREVMGDAHTPVLAALNYNMEVEAAPPVQIVAPPAPPPRSREARKDKATPMREWTMAEFRKAMPELKDVVPAPNQGGLAALLQATAQNVKTFFESLPDVSSHESILSERLDWGERRTEGFNYLALARPHSVLLEEYRTNAAGESARPKAWCVTEGFVSTIAHFHPLYLSEAVFRYLGTQILNGHPTAVVYFTQVPFKARMTQEVFTSTRSLQIAVQGVAWIDLDSYQIRRMRTELLAPQDDPDLNRETTELQFAEVHFQGVPRVFWLPKVVRVTVNWDGVVFRNTHRYSDYKLFRVEVPEHTER